MLYLIYERETGVVVSCVEAPVTPLMNHHNVIEYAGDKAPEFDSVRVKLDGSAVETVTPDIEIVRERALIAVNRKRDAIQRGGCQTPKGVMQSDSESRLMLSGAIQMAQIAVAQGGVEFSMGWTMADNTTVDHSAIELTTAGVTMGLFISRAHNVAIGLKAAINAALTVEDIEAIDIEGASWIV